MESTAAALGYGILSAGNKSVMVVDIGGGTTDITVMKVKDHKPSTNSETQSQGMEVRVIATAGHSQCGGRDIDHLLAWHLCGHILHTLHNEREDKLTERKVSSPSQLPEEAEVMNCLRVFVEKCRIAKVFRLFLHC